MKIVAKIALIVALMAAAYAARFVVIDKAEQGVLLLGPASSAECAAGGGCAAFSHREVQAISDRAMRIGFGVGRTASCGRDS